MKLVDTAIKKPVTVTVGVLLLVLFGSISLFRIPIQLTPNVDLPEISITTTWRGASPVEVEREIVDAQEDELKNLEGLVEIKSESQDSTAYINLMFEIGTDTDEALLRVSNSLERVKKYPDDVEKPIIKSGGRREKAIAWMVLQALDGYEGVLQEEYDFVFGENLSIEILHFIMYLGADFSQIPCQVFNHGGDCNLKFLRNVSTVSYSALLKKHYVSCDA